MVDLQGLSMPSDVGVDAYGLLRRQLVCGEGTEAKQQYEQQTFLVKVFTKTL